MTNIPSARIIGGLAAGVVTWFGHILEHLFGVALTTSEHDMLVSVFTAVGFVTYSMVHRKLSQDSHKE